MSGKKASEVNQLLKNGKNTRSGSINLLYANYRSMCDAAEEQAGAIAEAKDRQGKLTCSLNAAKKEFPDAAQQLEQDMRTLEQELEGLAESNKKASLEQKYASVNADYEAVDKRAEKVSNDLKRKICSQGRSDPWYCDSEYRAASKVAREYKSLAQKVNALNRELSAQAGACKTASAKARHIIRQAEKLAEEGQALEKKAAGIAQLRNDAGMARKSVTADLEQIDPNTAAKFLGSQYDALCQETKVFQGAPDAEVVKNFAAMTSKIKAFSVLLDQKYANFRKLQSEIKASLDHVSARLGNSVFSDPVSDFSQNGSKMMTLTEYLDTFCAGKYSGEIRQLLSEADSLYRAENFDDAARKLNNLTALIDSASEHAAFNHERRKKTIENAIAIRNTMMELHYDIESKIIVNEDGSYGGFDITCTAGDEKICFENVLVDEDGNFKFDIDHTESVSGTCSSSWHTIRNGLAENGIYVKDITKNGESIHAPNHAGQQKTDNSLVQQSAR